MAENGILLNNSSIDNSKNIDDSNIIKNSSNQNTKKNIENNADEADKKNVYKYIIIGVAVTLVVIFAILILLLSFPSLIINNSLIHNNIYNTQQNQLLSIFPVREIVLANNINNTKNYYYVYIAATPKLMEQGYMNSTTLGNCDNKGNCLGMLFLFNTSQNICMWMKNTEIPLKQIWFNSNGAIVYEVNALPYSTNAICHYGQFVLETNRSIPLNDIIEAP
ncbi:MAG: DUF192 domain-containing protein [Candidatus Micrarchaeia archaeon]